MEGRRRRGEEGDGEGRREGGRGERGGGKEERKGGREEERREGRGESGRRGMDGARAEKSKCTTAQCTALHTYQGLDHGRPLYSEVLDGLEHVHQPLPHHPLQNDVQGNEHSTAANAVAGGERSTRHSHTRHHRP